MRDEGNISLKTNRILNIFLLALILILIRVWFLSIIQHEDQLLLSQNPRRKSAVEKVDRGTIRDRYNIPLAENKTTYSVAIYYADLKEIPSFVWEKGKPNKKVPKRKEYIQNLCALLAKELQMDPLAIEDIIYGRAALFPQMPFIIKENLSESEYFKLRLLEKDWLGIRTQKSSKRVYPLGKTGCDIVGYMGSITDKEYRELAVKIAELEHYIAEREQGDFPLLPKGFDNPLEVRSQLKYLKERAYTLQDFVGKSGIEARFDKELRGIYGKKYYEIDTKGNVVHTLPGSREPSAARRVVLTISAELQEFAEKLLAERANDGSTIMKRGAIVAMDPGSGEILAMASYPRFSPQDFTPSYDPLEKSSKHHAISRWLETEEYLGEIWDGERPLEKEVFSDQKQFHEITEWLTWDVFLKKILSEKSVIFQKMKKLKTLKEVWTLQEVFGKIHELLGFCDPKQLIDLLYASSKSDQGEILASEELLNLRKELDPYLSSIPNTGDKLLFIDLCRLIVNKENFSHEAIELLENISLSQYFQDRQALTCLSKTLEKEARKNFQETTFQYWREEHFKNFLKEKREEEVRKKSYSKPYTDYLEAEEKRQFKIFWKKEKYPLLESLIFAKTPPKSFLDALFVRQLFENNFQQQKIATLQKALEAVPENAQRSYLHSMKSFSELNRPLLGKYPRVRHTGGKQIEKHLASAFYPVSGYGYVLSSAFRQSAPQGSIFKLVVGYEALKERYEGLQNHAARFLNPFTLTDQVQSHNIHKDNQVLGYTQEGQPITRMYKGGKLPRSHPNIGKIDLQEALEQSSNIYFSLLASEYIKTPSDLLEASREFGFGKKTAIDLPGETPGKLPGDITYNKTGLYAFAIGQHSLIVTPIQTAVMLSALANGGEVLKPQIIRMIAAKENNPQMSPFEGQDDFAFQEHLGLIGLHFPLFTETLAKTKENVLQLHTREVQNTVFLPDEIRYFLLEGMKKVISGPRGLARPAAVRGVCKNEKVFQDYLSLQQELVGKTGTAELLTKTTIDQESKAYIQNDIWFSGISFEKTPGNLLWDNPELSVVVYLHDGQSGREAVPYATQIIKKWKEIKKKHEH